MAFFREEREPLYRATITRTAKTGIERYRWDLERLPGHPKQGSHSEYDHGNALTKLGARYDAKRRIRQYYRSLQREQSARVVKEWTA